MLFYLLSYSAPCVHTPAELKLTLLLDQVGRDAVLRMLGADISSAMPPDTSPSGPSKWVDRRHIRKSSLSARPTSSYHRQLACLRYALLCALFSRSLRTPTIRMSAAALQAWEELVRQVFDPNSALRQQGELMCHLDPESAEVLLPGVAAQVSRR